ncbi:substrate-binding periplasmic protein [Pseudomonas sp. NPDC007930]|uniref:substrate-binding periplasmic protein n=1 Tax=Pseudomonas sp. NPDC007930 TaxID=3364417 RepID=UPI0036ED5F1F
MRVLFGTLALLAGQALAEQAPLRFAVAESWSMPLVRIEQGVPTEGILYDIMKSAAEQAGSRAEFRVMARLRTQAAMDQGEVDVRCYTGQSFSPNLSGDFIWSLPLVRQRDFLVGLPGNPSEPPSGQAPAAHVGTVLGYQYPALQGAFDTQALVRDDARNQDQVLLKLLVGRYRYAVSNELTLDWFNSLQPPEQRLSKLRLLDDQVLGCYVRNDPRLPVQSLLRAFVRMRQSGELERIFQRYQPGP